MIAIVDYGVGNLFSLSSSLSAIGAEACVSADTGVLSEADGIILPGVGAFSDAAQKLRASGLGRFLKAEAAKGKKILGICLGMQMLFDESLENGRFSGLGLIPGTVRPIAETIDPGLKIPHIGWNGLHFKQTSPLFKYIKDGDCVYFVHSYHAVTDSRYVIADTEYSAALTAAVAKGNLYGCQFHPEKSGPIGLKILKAFCEL